MRAPKDIVENTPENVVLTDFLPNDMYAALVKESDVIVCLTKNNNTMQCGGFEALEAQKPLITSNWKVLKDYFSKGTIHINNTSQELVEALKKIRDNLTIYSKEIQTLRNEKRKEWEHNLSILLEPQA